MAGKMEWLLQHTRHPSNGAYEHEFAAQDRTGQLFPEQQKIVGRLAEHFDQLPAEISITIFSPNRIIRCQSKVTK